MPVAPTARQPLGAAKQAPSTGVVVAQTVAQPATMEVVSDADPQVILVGPQAQSHEAAVACRPSMPSKESVVRPGQVGAGAAPR